MESNLVMIHGICENKLVHKELSSHVPRIGDEIRVSPTKFYKVERVVRCWDERTYGVERVNLGLLLISETKQKKGGTKNGKEVG